MQRLIKRPGNIPWILPVHVCVRILLRQIKSLTSSESAVSQAAHYVADNLAGTVALLQRQSSENVNRKKQNHEVRAEPGRKKRRIELDDSGRLADVDGYLGDVVLKIGSDGRLGESRTTQVEQLETVGGAHPRCRYQERHANAKVHLQK